MRRMFLIVAMLLIAVAPAMATVTVTTAHNGLPLVAGRACTNCTVTYNCGASEKVRAFALEITVDNGYTITAIHDYNVGDNNGYGIFPGAFRDVVNPADINWARDKDAGYNPIAPATDADAAGTGLGTNKIIVELGSLYATTAPASSGTLFNFDIMGTPGTTCNISLATNTTRGGVVLEDGSSLAVGPSTLVLTGATGKGFPDRFPCWQPYNAQYVQFIDPVINKPDCWAGRYASDTNWKFQCYGDTDEKVESIYKYRVYTSDYAKLVANWRKKATQLKGTVLGNPAICTDFDHMQESIYKYRVYTSDYARLVANWRKKDTQLLNNLCPGPNADANY